MRTSFLDDSHAYWNGTSLFFFVEGELDRPCRGRPSRRRRARGWRVATALPADARARASPTPPPTSTSCVDSPFEVGHARAARLHASGGTQFELALYGRTNADAARLVDILAPGGRPRPGRMFGGFPFRPLPVHRPRAAGRLGRARAPRVGDHGHRRPRRSRTRPATSASPISAAHEFFHAWNVKRIHDAALGPFDYTRENYTRLLWLYEGFTDYLAHVIILRAGRHDREATSER